MKKLLPFLFFTFTIFSFSQEFPMQNATISQCGFLFTDSGSSTGNYDNNENFVLTLCPQTVGDFVQLEFSSFSTQLQADIMTIYNGDSTSSPLIGEYSGGGMANNPGTIIADNTTGCLTITFVSDSVAVTTGWLAEVSCIPNGSSASFIMTPDCNGAIADIIGTPGGMFAFNPIPQDSVTINPTTGEVTNATSGATYTVEYTVDAVTESETFTVLETPVANTPTSIVLCQDNLNETATFDIYGNAAEILGGQDPNTYTVTVYLTEADALAGTNPLANPYTNASNPETVYAVVTSNNGGCISNVVSFNLLVNAMELIPTVIDDCDGASTGEVTLNVTGGIAPYTFSIDGLSYQTSNVFTSLSAGTYTFNVIDSLDCIGELSVTIGEGVTVVQPTPLYVIDDDNDGFAAFNLIDKDVEIAGGNVSLNVTYYETEADANNNTNALLSPYNNIVAFEQTVYVRVEDINNGCYTITTLELVVEYVPFIVNEAGLHVCQTNPNAIETFDLTLSEADILNGLNASEYAFAYYETEGDAINFNNPITNPSVYTNQTPQQIIYVGVTENATGESVITYLFLIVDQMPIIQFDSNLSICTGTTLELFPYTVVQNNVDYQWSTGETTPTILVIQAGIYMVDMINTVTGCTNTGSVTVTEAFFPTLGTATNFTSCNPDELFDLTATIPQILDGLDPNDYVVTFHENETDAANGVNPIPNPSAYNPINNTQTITALVSAAANSCSSLSFFEIITESCPTTVTCGTPVSTSFCYTNNETQQYNFISSDGSPLYIMFNSGITETNFDELIVLDSDGVTNLNTGTPYGNNGDLTGLTFTTTGDSATVFIQSDASVISCTNNPIDFNVFCGSDIGFIEVNAFLDENNDGVFNGSDSPFTNGFFTYELNNDGNINTVNSNTGSYTIYNQDETNSYDITFAANAGYENCFNIPTALFENVMVTNGNTVVIDFPVTEQMPCEDLAVYLVPFSAPRPGFNHWNDLVIENLGSTVIASGTVTFINDPIVNYVDATPVSPELTVTPTSTGATVDFTNLLPGETRTVWFQLYTPPSVNLGEFVTSSAAYTTAANDVVAENNVSVVTQEVIGSYDPNDITESHGRDIVYDDFITTDEYLYYTIRFQNIGTAEAINVRIENTVDPLLDISTLQMLRSSHDVVMKQNVNQLTWTFDNINLPAQSQDDFGSNGYVYFKIKPTAGYALGTMIPNTAEIYFDFNAPVITNTFITEFVENALSVDEFNSNSFSLYPNPAKEVITIKLNNASRGKTSVVIIDLQGKKIMSKTIEDAMQDLQINISNLETGLYFVKLKNNSKETIKKLIIE